MMYFELWQWFDEVLVDCKLDEAFGSVVGGSSRLIVRRVHTFDCVCMDRNHLCLEVDDFVQSGLVDAKFFISFGRLRKQPFSMKKSHYLMEG